MGLKTNFAWLSVSKVFQIGVGIFTAGLINRSIGPMGRGIYAEIQTWIALYIALFGISINSSIYHFADKKKYNIPDKEKLTTIILLSCFCSIIAASFFIGLVVFFPEKVHTDIPKYILILCILIFIMMVNTNIDVFYNAQGNIKLNVIAISIYSGVTLIIIAFGFIEKIINIDFLVYALLAQQLILLCIYFVISMRPEFLCGRFLFSKTLAKEMVRSGLKLHIGTISAFIYTKVNILILSRYCGEIETGYYSVAMNLSIYLTIIPMTLQTVMYPRVIHSLDDYEVTIRAMRLILYGWGIIVIILMLSAKPIILIYAGSQFLPSVNVFRILLIFTWFLPVSSLLAPFWIKKGAFMIFSILSVINGIVSIILNISLIPKYLSIGASYAASISTVIGFMAGIIFLWYLSRRNPLVIFKPDFVMEKDYIKKLSIKL